MEERVKTLSHEAAHYQMLSAQQRMIIQSLEDDLRSQRNRYEECLEEARAELQESFERNANRDQEQSSLNSDLKTERDLATALRDQLETARRELRDKDSLIEEKNDALRVREETILQLRMNMKKFSRNKAAQNSRDEERAAALTAMEETRQHLMQMQVSKENLATELEQSRNEVSRKNNEVQTLRERLDSNERDLRLKNAEIAKLRRDFIAAQENLVRKNELVRTLTEQVSVSRPDNTETEQMTTELATVRTQLNDTEAELEEVKAQLNEHRELLNRPREDFSKDWILQRNEITLTEKVIGVGAWGNVKVGKFRGSEVAVKQIHLLILSPHNRRLFEREMEIASKCRNPYLVQFIGATNDDGTPLFVMELLETSLRDHLLKNPLENFDCVQIALDVIKAITYLHLSKPVPIIHRDVSSSNVLLYRGVHGWRAKLSDYGAANFMRLSMTRHPGGLLYSAPEASTIDQTPKVP